MNLEALRGRSHLRSFTFTILVTVVVALRQTGFAGPVAVPNSNSPGNEFALQLTNDRKAEEIFEGAVEVQIISVPTKRVLATLPFAGDPNDDLQPLRSHLKVHWCPDSGEVAIGFAQRNQSSLAVFRLEGTLAAPQRFMPVTLPDTAAIVRATIPRFRHFKGRWHEQFQGWLDSHMLVYSAGDMALIEPLRDGEQGFRAVYSFTIDITDPKTPVVKRAEVLHDPRDF